MKSRKIKLILIGTLTALTLGFFAVLTPSFAQTPSGISISPLVFELSANPGDTLSEKVQVANPSDQPITVSFESADFTPQGEEGQVQTLPLTEKSTYSLANWISIDSASIVVPAKNSQLATFDIKVPANGEPGGHYASVLAVIKGSSGVAGSAVAITQKVGSLVLLKVAGVTNEVLTVKEFRVPTLLETGPVDMSVRFENQGNVHVRPVGFVTITNIFGQKVAELPLEQKNILPGSIRRFDLSWKGRILPGWYHATLTGIYGSQNHSITATQTFYIFPWKIGIPILLILLIMGYLTWHFRHRIMHAYHDLTRDLTHD